MSRANAAAPINEASMLAEDGVTMNPDHPLLKRAQEALKKQLVAERTRLEEEVRGKQNAVKAAKARRETIGVELYGFQQNLAKLQLQLEQTHQQYVLVNSVRGQAEGQLSQLRTDIGGQELDTKGERGRVEKCQAELDRLGATLKQIEAYNEQMKGEIAVTRRAAYAAEGAAQKLEKDKMQQDYRIDTMTENLKAAQQQLQLVTAQTEAQKRETRAALETLAEAESEMEGVHFEKKQLVAQWKSSLVAIQKRDEALNAIQDAVRAQAQQAQTIEQEIEGYRKDIIKEQVKNEQMAAVLRKVEGDTQFVNKQSEACQEKQARLQEMYAKLAKSLEHTEEQIKRAAGETKALAAESLAVERAHTKVAADVRTIEEEVLVTLSEQTTAEKSSGKTAADIGEMRKRVREEEMHAVEAQNELAKLQVDILNTEAHNARLLETLRLLDEELEEKARAIEKYEAEIKRRNDEIEKKTREIDLLNRRYEKMMESQQGGEETGPLEATIKNLSKEIDTKGVESKELQRRWIRFQTELVTLQNDNGALAETLTRTRAEQTVLFQKRRRLEAQLETRNVEVKALTTGMSRLNVELQRVNSLIAANSSARQALQEDNFNLENRIMGELRDLEEESAKLNSQIQAGREAKRETLSEIVEVERQIMLWERKIELEREMQEVLDPTVGQDVVTEMKKEIHRMQLRHGELMRLQEKLMQDMEKALGRREVIHIKGRATAARAKTSQGDTLTRNQLDKAVAELTKSIRDTEREMAATDARIRELDAQRSDLSGRVASGESACRSLRQSEEELHMAIADGVNQKYTLLLASTRLQRTNKRLEDWESGKYKAATEDPEQAAAEREKASAHLSAVIALCEQLREAMPEMGGAFDKVLCHVAVT